MKFHPYAEVFPLLDADRLAELSEDIKAFGLREPIWLFDKQILDGRNRFLACQKAKVKPTYRTFKGTDQGALALVISTNIQRRHLSDAQRAFAAAKIATLKLGANQHSSKNIGSNGEGGSREPPSQAAAAEQLGVSRSSVKRARKVIEKGSTALQRAVEADQISLKKAAAVVDLPKSEQLAAAQAPKEPAEDREDLSAFAEDIQNDQREYYERLERALEGNDQLTSMAAELKRVSQEVIALRQARDRYMNESSAKDKRIKALEREVKRLKGSSEKTAPANGVHA